MKYQNSLAAMMIIVPAYCLLSLQPSALCEYSKHQQFSVQVNIKLQLH